MVALKTTVKFTPLKPESLAFTAAQMRQLGALGIATIRDRVSRGIGSDDAPMKALQPAYARQKGRRGLPQVRNLMGTGRNGGHMLDQFSVRRVTASEVRIDITGQSARRKATATDKQSPWYGWSPEDAASILGAAQDMARGNIREVTAERGLSIWQDPYRYRSVGMTTRS